MTVGKNIRRIRKEKGLTQSALAKRLGVTPAMISQYENSAVPPKVKTMENIARELGVSISELLEGEEISDVFQDFQNPLKSLEDIGADMKNNMEQRVLQEIEGNIHRLNNTGKLEAAKRIEELTHIEKYTKKEE